MRLIDRFTTQSGSWDVDITHQFGIDLMHRDRYQAGSLIPGAGADHHIMVNAPVGSNVAYITADGKGYFSDTIRANGWVNFPLSHDASYNPDTGAKGPWQVWVNGEMVADGIGLPYGWHVSTYLVVEQGGTVTPPTTPTDSIQVIVNGVWYDAVRRTP